MRSLRRSSRQKGASDTTGEAGEADDGSTKEHGAYYLESTAVADSGMSSKAFKKCMRLDSRRYKREHGNAVHAPDPYSNHAFLYVAPEGVDSPAPISLVQWTKLCFALGDDGTAKLEDVQAQHFTMYTGLEYTAENVGTAIESGVLLMRSKLQSVNKAGAANNSGDDRENDSETSSQSDSASVGHPVEAAPGYSLQSSHRLRISCLHKVAFPEACSQRKDER